MLLLPSSTPRRAAAERLQVGYLSAFLLSCVYPIALWAHVNIGIHRNLQKGISRISDAVHEGDLLVPAVTLSPIWCHFAFFFLLEVTGTITPGAVSSGCLWLYRLLWCSSFQPEFRLFNYCSYQRLFIPYFAFLTFLMHFAPSFWLDRLRETGLNLKCLNESACVQVKIVILEWLIFLVFKNFLNRWHKLDTTKVFGQSAQWPRGVVEVTG